MLDLGAAAIGPGDGDDVEAGSVIEKAVTLEIGRGEKSELALLGEINGFGGMALLVGVSRFDFDEDHGATVDGDEVEFSQAGADAATDDAEATTLEKASGNRFATFAQGAGGGRSPTTN